MKAHSALEWMARLCDATMEVKNGAIYVGVSRAARLRRRWFGGNRNGKQPLGRLEIGPDGNAKFEFFIYEDDLPPAVRARLLQALHKALKDMEGEEITRKKRRKKALAEK